MGTRQENETIEIDLGQIFRVIWKNIRLILIVTVLFGAVALLVTTFFIHPTYRSSFTAYVNNHAQSQSASSLTSGDTAAAESLAYTYSSIITSRDVLNEAADRAGLDYTYEELKDFVTTEVQSDTQLVDVYVTMESPKEAYRLSRSLSKTAMEYAPSIVEGTSMQLVSKADRPKEPYSPSKMKNTVISAFVGFLLAIFFVIIRSMLDTRVKSQEQLEETFGLSVIGVIPNFQTAGDKDRYGYGYNTRK